VIPAEATPIEFGRLLGDEFRIEEMIERDVE
jgi:hypothetical protein